MLYRPGNQRPEVALGENLDTYFLSSLSDVFKTITMELEKFQTSAFMWLSHLSMNGPFPFPTKIILKDSHIHTEIFIDKMIG